MSSPEASVIQLSAVSCSRAGGDASRAEESLHGISAGFRSGRFHLVTGPSSGERSLLLRFLSLLEAPDSGDVFLDGCSTRLLDESARAELRAKRLGLVFASPFLLPSLTAIENIAVPLFRNANLEPDDARQRAEAALDFVGLNAADPTRTGDLGRYAQHCVSLARALAAEPGVLLVEEVDSMVSGDALQQFTSLLRLAAERFELAAIATSSPEFATGASGRVVSVAHGVIEYDTALLREPLA